MQLLHVAGEALGLEEAYVRELADLAWETYPELPKLYHSDECRPGGELDLDPDDPEWPSSDVPSR